MVIMPKNVRIKNTAPVHMVQLRWKKAGAELCQAQHRELVTLLLGLLTQPAMARAGSFAEMQLSINCHGGIIGWTKCKIRLR